MNGDKVNATLDLLNSACPEIQFTCELDKKNELPFLDLNIQHPDDGTISLDIYRKNTCTDRI